MKTKRNGTPLLNRHRTVNRICTKYRHLPREVTSVERNQMRWYNCTQLPLNGWSLSRLKALNDLLCGI